MSGETFPSVMTPGREPTSGMRNHTTELKTGQAEKCSKDTDNKWCAQNFTANEGKGVRLKVGEKFQVEHFQKCYNHPAEGIKERSFWFLASFQLSHGGYLTRSFAEPSPKTKNPRSE